MSRTDEATAGQIIGGRYVLSTPLGQGGMGSVWRATDATRDVDVAVKVVSPHAAQGRDLRAAFQQETDLSERMLSRNIVRVLDRGLDPWPFMVLELLHGTTLSSRLVERPLDVGEMVTVVTQVCRALARAHAVSVVHRDIKPDNLFVVHEDGSPLVKVLDFGVAALRGNDTADDNKMSGTIGYMSPEHMLEGIADERADLFALGVVAYDCLLGKLPFSDQSLADYLMAVSTTRPAPPSSVLTHLPPGIDPWFDRALAFDRSARFASANEMAEALNEAYRPMVQASVTASRRERANGPRKAHTRTATPPDRPIEIKPASTRTPKAEAPKALPSKPPPSSRNGGRAKTRPSAGNTRAVTPSAAPAPAQKPSRARTAPPPPDPETGASGRYVVVLPRENRRKPK